MQANRGPNDRRAARPGASIAGFAIKACDVAKGDRQGEGRIKMITAYDLAEAYSRAISAYWRGDGEIALSRLSAWLGQFWTETPAELTGPPVLVSPHAGGGRGIHWHEVGSSILGCVPGQQGCYRIPQTSILPTETICFRESTIFSRHSKQRAGAYPVKSNPARVSSFAIRHRVHRSQPEVSTV